MRYTFVPRRRNTSPLFAGGSPYGVKINIDPMSIVSETVSDFPYMINDFYDIPLYLALCDPASPTPCRSDAGDLILLTDPYNINTRLGIDIVRFTQDATPSNREFQMWIEAGELDNTTTKDLYLVWGNPANSQPARNAPFGSEQVWAQSPGGVLWDFVCDMKGTTTINDSSSFNNSIIKPDYNNHGPYESDNDVPFNSGSAQIFTGDNASVLEVPSLANNFSGNVSISFWMRRSIGSSTPSGFERIISNKITLTQPTGFEVTFVPGQPNQLLIQGPGSNSTIVNLTKPVYGGGDPWTHYSVQFNSSGDAWIIQDGVLHPAVNNIGTVQIVNQQLVIGNDSDRNEAGFVGRLSHFRILDENLNESYVDLMYENMKNPGANDTVTFITP